MIQMTLEQYLHKIVYHSKQFENRGEWYDTVVKHWIEDVAPVKSVEYGIECWQRLGSRGLLADISACYYRWERLRTLNRNGAALENALVDLYGYTAMFSVCLNAERNLLTMQYQPAFEEHEPKYLNEWLITHIWDNPRQNRRVESASRLVATQLAINAWETYH